MKIDVHNVASIAGLSVVTIRDLHKRATRERRTGNTHSRTMPAPVGLESGRNVWDSAEIEAWVERRETPARSGPIPKSEIIAIRDAAYRGDVDQVITIAERNI